MAAHKTGNQLQNRRRRQARVGHRAGTPGDLENPSETQVPSKNRRGFSTMSCWMSASEAPNSFSLGSTFLRMKL